MASLPSGLDGLWQLFVDAFTLVAVGVLVVAAVVRRRWALVRDLVLAAVVGRGLAVVVARVVRGLLAAAGLVPAQHQPVGLVPGAAASRRPPPS